ncbi:cholinesterase-like [Glandiceps talaboti]
MTAIIKWSTVARFITLAMCVYLTASSKDQPVVLTNNGPVKGKIISVVGKDLEIFLSIPYARPPIGNLRFRPPEPVDAWDEALDVSEFKTSCWQVHDRGYVGSLPLSEDCLHLNVWVSHPRPKSAAVMVFIHGGGFTWGSATTPNRNGQVMAASEGIIVVSMNYRLGVFGFLALGIPDAPGNMGLLDQQLAMKWVQENIAAFGGDPHRVTINGNSAGGASVGYHLLAPESQDLFTRAIIQSGYILNSARAFISAEAAKERASDLVKDVCPSHDSDGNDDITSILHCLKEKPAEDIMKVHKPFTMFKTPFPPVLDGVFISEEPRTLVGKGKFKKVNLLMGTVKHESSDMTVRIGLPGVSPENDYILTSETFHNLVKLLYPLAGDPLSIVAQYDKTPEFTNGAERRDILINMNSEYGYICPSQELANAYTNSGLDVYYYEMDHFTSISTQPKWMGTPHAAEIQYLFGQPLLEENPYSEEDKQFSRQFMKYWCNFVKTGDPNKKHENEVAQNRWPYFGPKGRYITLSGKRINNPEISFRLRAENCHFWTKQTFYNPSEQVFSKSQRDEL